MQNLNNCALILASGGIDSTACVNFYKKLNFTIKLIFIDYGQLAKEYEYDAVTAIAKYYDVFLQRIIIKNNEKFADGFVMGRNAMFYFIALNNFGETNGLIVSGIHNGTDYYDCSEIFISDMQKIFDQYSFGCIKLDAPFINFSKGDIVNYCRLENVPIHLTYSCELGRKQPCGICKTCIELITINNKGE